jgi:hypothetical protein
MTPDDFQRTVVPDVIASWERRCFCANPGFRKLLSFNFEDYNPKLREPSSLNWLTIGWLWFRTRRHIGPLALADSEILGTEIIIKRFTRLEGPPAHPRSSEHFATYRCPRCAAICCGYSEQYSINMDRTYFLFDGAPSPAPSGVYLVGFYGYDRGSRIPDFTLIADRAAFLASIGAGSEAAAVSRS